MSGCGLADNTQGYFFIYEDGAGVYHVQFQSVSVSTMLEFNDIDSTNSSFKANPKAFQLDSTDIFMTWESNHEGYMQLYGAKIGSDITTNRIAEGKISGEEDVDIAFSEFA